MTWLPNRTPQPGSVDWAAQRIRRMLDREEEEISELRRLQAEDWRPPRSSQPSKPIFGDERDLVAGLIQSEIDHQKALLSEARRRIDARRLGTSPTAQPTDPAERLHPVAAEFLSGARRIDGGLLAQDRDIRPRNLRAVPSARLAPGLHLVGSPMNSGQRPPQIPMTFIQMLDPRHPFGAGAGAGAYLTTERAIRHWMNTRDMDDEIPAAPPRDFEPVDGATGRAENIPLEAQGGPPGYPGDPEPKSNRDPDIRTHPALNAYPGLSDWIEQEDLFLQNSKGDAQTQADNDSIIKLILEGLKARGVVAQHSHGATLKERYLVGPNKQRQGSARPDGTINLGDDEAPEYWDFNTTDMLKDRKTPNARERRALEKIHRLKRDYEQERPGHLDSFPKSRGWDPDEWRRAMAEAIEELLDARFGPRLE